MSSDLYQACKTGLLPSIATMSKFGLLGHDQTNPIFIFDCYKRAVSSGFTEKDFDIAYKNGSLEKIIKSYS